MTQQRLPIEHSLPSTLGEAHEMIRDLLRLHENAEKRQVEIQEHFQKQLTRVKKLFKIAVTRIYGSSLEASKALFNEAESVTSELPSAEPEETLPFCTGSEDDSAKPAGTDADKDKPKTRKRGPIPPHLTRVDIVHDLSADNKSCTTDGSALVKIGEKVREELVVIPSMIVHRHITQKYGYPKCHRGIIVEFRLRRRPSAYYLEP